MPYFRWSYGIVLWELITLGMLLLPNNVSFVKLIKCPYKLKD